MPVRDCLLQTHCPVAHFFSTFLDHLKMKERRIVLTSVHYLFNNIFEGLLLPPLKFHCAVGCWDRTQDRCNWCIGSQTLSRLDLVRTRLDLIRQYTIIPHSSSVYRQMNTCSSNNNNSLCCRRSAPFCLRPSRHCAHARALVFCRLQQ